MKAAKALFYAAFLATLAHSAASRAEPKVYSFGVIPQRSATLTAQFWNPILDYASRKSGVPLALALSKTGPEHSAAIGQGRFDFIYSNHNFTIENDKVGYRVIARWRDTAIRGEIVVLASSPLATLGELENREVAFPSNVAFVGFQVPMEALLRVGVTVRPVFAGNQEGAMGQLKFGRVAAAGVNSRVMRDFAEREKLAYRVLWRSEEYLDIPISAHPSVPVHHVKSVQQALIQMDADPEGAAILAASAALVKSSSARGFVTATDAEYNNHRRFHATARVVRMP